MKVTGNNMQGFARRTILGSSARAAFAGGLMLQGMPILAASGISIPAGSMRLTRRLERGLHDGASIVVERDWRVDFSRQGRGIAIDGTQISVRVDAPEKLAPLAKIEESRSTADMWPILLSEDGQILAAGEYTRDEDLAEAIRMAEKLIAQRKEPPEKKAQHREYLARMQQAGSSLFDQLPPDLFFPRGGNHETVREISLAEGLKGEFFISYSAETAAGRGWLAHARRRVITRIGDETRRSQEDWLLAGESG
ncbi:hypothetical protein ACI5KX_01560 [Erythrobacter sp. GH1-10]|uniref:hypothetical protein n=1 Tax=Erythrobacter sp. GH1-10 TaxID=3349334 RepID=UPI003877B256